jgi:hypothetical protein
MHQGSSLKGDVATVVSMGSIWHSTSEPAAERDKRFASADYQNFPVNAASARDTTGSNLDADLSLPIGDQSSTTFLNVFGE